MVIVISGTNWEKKPCEFYLDQNLKNALDEVKGVVGTGVKTKDWDYIALVAGNPGTGKSNFAQNCAKYCCEWFDINYVCMTADQFIKITNECPNNSAVVLDESFASLNTKVSRSSDFVRIINHLQLLRQKNLYIFLCLPNFFDLAKGIAIYRSHHLFVTYSPKFGDRGSFAAYSRETKKNLYILGSKFMNYNAVQPNFRGRFVKSKCINQEEYERKKLEHLQTHDAEEGRITKSSIARDRLVRWMRENTELTIQEIADIAGIARVTAHVILSKEGV